MFHLSLILRHFFLIAEKKKQKCIYPSTFAKPCKTREDLVYEKQKAHENLALFVLGDLESTLSAWLDGVLLSTILLASRRGGN